MKKVVHTLVQLAKLSTCEMLGENMIKEYMITYTGLISRIATNLFKFVSLIIQNYFSYLQNDFYVIF